MLTNGTLDSNFFANNRKRLREIFGGSAPIVIAGNSLLQKSGDSHHTFRQDSNFWYLTGLSLPGLTLVLDGDKEYIILPKRSPLRSTFDGIIDNDNLTSSSAIKDICSNDEGWERLARKLSRVKHVATLQPTPSYIEELDMFINPSQAHLITKLQEHNSDLDLIDLRSIIGGMRVIKTDDELKMIKNAVKETISLFHLLEKKRTSSKYEYELLAEIEARLVRRQIDKAYDPVIASAQNSLTLHYTSNNSPINQNEFLLIDLGVRTGGYSADITRTVVSNPSKRQQVVYEAVLAVHGFACSLLKPGTNLKTYEEAVFQYMGEKLRELGLIRTISKETVREFYPHSTSHFIGIDVHDAGDYHQPLEPGMVLSVEPGIYIQNEGFGIRLEDTLAITKDGNANLSEQLAKRPDSLI